MKAAGTKRFVVDASMTLSWCFEAESTPFTEAILDSLTKDFEALVPAIWPLEMANALLVGERLKRVTTAEVSSILKRIVDLPISVDPIRVESAFGTILFLARKEHLSEYDASYIELALREGVPLATLDERLRHAASNSGVPLIRI